MLRIKMLMLILIFASGLTGYTQTEDIENLDLLDSKDAEVLTQELDSQKASDNSNQNTPSNTPENSSEEFAQPTNPDELPILEPDDKITLTPAEDQTSENNSEQLGSEDAIDLEELESLDGGNKTAPPAAKANATATATASPTSASGTPPADEVASDELEELKLDIGVPYNAKTSTSTDAQIAAEETPKQPIEIFDIGSEEKKLLELSQFVKDKIPDDQWDEIAARAQTQKYVVQTGDWLWKISKRLFGSGFYYSKIWSLNPYIANPHEIEPGMTLVFDTGSADFLPKVQVGSFSNSSWNDEGEAIQGENGDAMFKFGQFGESTEPAWIKERKRLMDSGAYFQFTNENSYEDLAQIGQSSLVTEYERYSPPVLDVPIEVPVDKYDDAGIDKNSMIRFNIKEDTYINTFITSGSLHNLGQVDSSSKEGMFLQQFDSVFIKFSDEMRLRPGDMFSVYKTEGKVSYNKSDRYGHRFTIVAHVRILRQINNLWEAEVMEINGILERGDYVTVYTPRIGKIVESYNSRSIEAVIVDSHRNVVNGLSDGDLVYLDRGRVDGVELGNVFSLYSRLDRALERAITPDPTYVVGEVTVVNLTDNFATAIISKGMDSIDLGTLAITKPKEEALKQKLSKATNGVNKPTSKKDHLEELDVELKLDTLSQDMLDKVERIDLADDELEELERQEREKSVIKEEERDLKELERLEGELLDSEGQLQEAKLDEDKFLEQQDLNKIEKKSKGMDPNAIESLDDIEKEIGRKYLDEDLNAKENPYGLTEFDLEEIDELLNTDQKPSR